MDSEAIPEGVMLYKLSPKAAAIANTILQVVKQSTVVITQLLQKTTEVEDSVMNGIVSSKEIPISEHYQTVQDFCTSSSNDCALYMHNKSLIEVAGAELVHKLYRLVPTMKQDVLVNYPLLYISDNPKSSNDVLVGSKDSWSPLHQDLPLYCTSAILVLEGHKEFVVIQEDVVPSLQINLASGCWDKPITHQGHVYPDLGSLVQATGGAVITLRAGDLMLMPPRMFHLARNCAPTVSCNFSICTMESVPLTVAQTLVRIEQCPRDVMHFDSDFARLLDDCTKAILQQAPVRASSITTATNRKRLPCVQSILNSSVRLMEWYMTLQCIPNGWVEGFWGPVRTRLLDQLLRALPLHNRSGDSGEAIGTEKSMAAMVTGPSGTAAIPGSNATKVGTGVAIPAADRGIANGKPPTAPRALNGSKMVGPNAGTLQQQQQAKRGTADGREAPLRSTRSDAAALVTAAGGAGDGAPWPRKRVRLMGGQGVATGPAVMR
ncbi:hypothetical protein Vafri_12877 [Volvox africanus]|uniref:JmjC domain-containing protein n=2 Tax=Volvox africanus TaxID=51714 RepID=A0A8J4BAD8_9CHLO|nr:hypothetical protein Vafri_12877 [Volvox africanus]